MQQNDIQKKRDMTHSFTSDEEDAVALKKTDFFLKEEVGVNICNISTKHAQELDRKCMTMYYLWGQYL